MNFRDLEYLVILSEVNHFRRAAKVCNIAQPTLSGQIKKLEEELDVLLIERTSRRVFFTQTGLEVVEQAKVVLQELKKIKDIAKQQTGEVTGPLHIGIIPTVAPYLLSYILELLQTNYPEAEIFIHEEKTKDLIQKLELGKMDCVILAQVKETEAFIEVPLFDEKLFFTVPATDPLASEKVIDLSTLKDRKFLMLEDGHCLRNHAMGYCSKVGIEVDERFKATSLETLRSMISAGGGVSLFPALSVPKDKNLGNVRYIPCKDPAPTRNIELIYRPGSALREKYEAIAKLIKKHMGPIINGEKSADNEKLK